MDTEYINHNLVWNACKRQEKKNIKKYLHSTAAITILNHINQEFLIETQHNSNIVIIKKGWRDKIKEYKQ